MATNAIFYKWIQETKKIDYEMNCVKSEGVQYNGDLCVTIRRSLKFSQQRKDAADKADRMLGLINRNFSFKNKDIILSLYISLVRPTWNMRCNFGRFAILWTSQK